MDNQMLLLLLSAMINKEFKPQTQSFAAGTKQEHARLLIYSLFELRPVNHVF